DRHPEAFGDALDNFVPATHEIRGEKCLQKCSTARQSFPHARPVHRCRLEYQRKIDHSPNDQCPAKPSRPDQRWFFPLTGRGGGNYRHFASPSSRGVTTDGCLLDITSF